MNETIVKLKQIYKQIKGSNNLLEENIKIHLVCDVFLNDLGYDTSVSACSFEQKKANTFADIVLKINNDIGLIIETKSCEHIITDIDIVQLANYVRNRGVEYGILTNGKEFLLINTNIRTSANFNNDMLKHQIVFWFNIFDTKSKQYTHHDFFYFLSKETIFDTKVTSYFRDIAQYKALKFPESNASWYNYKSTIYRFFEYYAGIRKRYNSGILEDITNFDFQNFISYKQEQSLKGNSTKLLTDNSIMNNYSHISSMLNTLVESEFGGINKTHFDKGRGKNLADIVSGTLSRMYHSIDNETFTQAVNYYLAKDKGFRDLAILLLCCCYGMERPKIQDLKWSDILVDKHNKSFNKINVDERILPLNSLLISCLQIIKNEQQKEKLKSNYVFMAYYKGNFKNISTAVVNRVFNQLTEISNDDKWSEFSPQFVRTALIIKLFEFGYTIDNIIYITGLPIENVSNYIKTEAIIEQCKKRKSTPSLSNLNNIFGDVLEKGVIIS